MPASGRVGCCVFLVSLGILALVIRRRLLCAFVVSRNVGVKSGGGGMIYSSGMIPVGSVVGGGHVGCDELVPGVTSERIDTGFAAFSGARLEEVLAWLES